MYGARMQDVEASALGREGRTCGTGRKTGRAYDAGLQAVAETSGLRRSRICSRSVLPFPRRKRTFAARQAWAGAASANGQRRIRQGVGCGRARTPNPFACENSERPAQGTIGPVAVFKRGHASVRVSRLVRHPKRFPGRHLIRTREGNTRSWYEIVPIASGRTNE